MPREIHLYIPAFVVSLATGILIFLSHGNLVIASLPILLLAVLTMSSAIARVITERRALLVYIFVAFFVDDLSVRSWNTITTITETLGILLYSTKLVGLNGVEIGAVLFTFWLLLTQKSDMHGYWLQQGVFPVLMLTLMVMSICLLSAAHGLMTGGTMKTVTIQIRFMHLLPLWSLVGFLMISQVEYANKILKVFSLTMIFKGFQGIFVYFMNKSVLAKEEYLLNHFASALWVGAVVYWVIYLAQKRAIWPQKLWRCALLIGPIYSYVLNDRRTANVGLVFAGFALAFFLPLQWWRAQVKKMLIFTCFLMLFIGATWNMPTSGLGFLAGSIKSIVFPEVTEIDSRKIENFNLLSTVIDNPVAGIGIGKEYPEIRVLPSISAAYTRDQIMPHNGILFFWAYDGAWGMAGVGTLFAFMIGSFGKLILKKGDSGLFLMGTTCLFLTVEYLMFTFGDMSFQNNGGQCLIGLMFGGAIRILAELRQSEARELQAITRKKLALPTVIKA